MNKILSGLLAIITAAVCVTFVSAAKVGFSDVTEDRWSAAAIGYAVENGYMNGVGDGKFDPKGSLTRAMVATVLWRREGSPAPTTPSGFTDVASSAWFSDAVAWAKEAGVVRGMTATTFAPNVYITREQLAAMLFRFSSTEPVSVPERADLSLFADGEKASGWAKESLEWAVEAGLINGTDGNRLAPGGNATREQFAAIIERYDGSFKLVYNEPVLLSQFTEKDYPLVEDADFYVSTAGSDDQDGSFGHPFATWNRAVEAVRELKKTKTGDITVAFMAGEYGPLSVSLSADDSGSETQKITYCKYGDGDVIFDGGFTVIEDEFVPLDAESETLFTEKYRSRILKADISDRLSDYDPVRTMVLSDDGVCTLARYPNMYADGTDHLLDHAGETVDEEHIVTDLLILKNRIDKYRTTEGLLLYGYLTTGWYKDTLETDGYDKSTGSFHIPHPEKARMGKLRMLPEFDSRYWNKTAVVNVSEELDAKGEYWIDRDTGTFYVFSPSGEYRFAGGGDMITLDSARYITLRGLTFENCEKYMIKASGHPRGLTIDGCSFSGGAGDLMVRIIGGNKGEPLDVTVKDSSFSACTSTALQIEGLNDDDLFNSSSGVLVDNNFFTLTNLRIGNKAALAVKVPAPLISHNVFKKCYWEAILFSAPNMIAEYNVFDEVCYNGDDTGAFQNYRIVRECGNIVRNNLFMNIDGGTNGRYGLYLDASSGVTVESNIFYNCAVPVMNNGLNKLVYVNDNVFVSPEKEIFECVIHADGNRSTKEAMETGNYDDIYNSIKNTNWRTAFEYFDAHPETKAQAEAMWPEFFRITLDIERIGEPEFFRNTSVVCVGNVSVKKKGNFGENDEVDVRYSTFEDNRVFRTDENPLFVNPTRGDYRLKPDAGFPDIEFEKIGRY
ncbi:MAG: S-layer homology domain-containing protein [Clostridia bacterium]|nr:S-layer homology domain-containing protein [Clostridia bacterium]